MNDHDDALVITDLCARVEGREILRGVTLTVRPGEVHAVMGPNGSGKSTLAHVLMGRSGYEVTGGSARLGGVELLDLPTWERAKAGLFLALQYPTEVPGVALREVLAASATAAGRDAGAVADRVAAEAAAVGLEPAIVDRALNVDFSGGEKKRNETVQLAVLDPKVAVLDELDSGLDVDALRQVSQRIEAATDAGLGVLAITHYTRLLDVLRADVVHVFAGGRILETGGREIADRLEAEGYGAFVTDADLDVDLESESGTDGAGAQAAATADPLADPFADPLA